MATVSINQTGATTAIMVYATAEEQSASGNYRTIYLSVWAEPKDSYTGQRDADWTFSYTDAYGNSKNLSSPNNAIITSKMSIFNGPVVVYVDPGDTAALTNISFTAVLHSPSAGNRYISGSITEISGLSLAADAVISSAKDIYFGDACQIVWTPTSWPSYYKLTFSLGDSSYTTDVITTTNTDPYQYTDFYIPIEWAIHIPNNVSATVRVSLTQYENSSGTATIGDPGSSTFKATLKDDVIPVVESCLIQINNESNEVVQTWGIPLAGYTRLSLTMKASGSYGSSIRSYGISGDYTTILSLLEDDGSATYTGSIIMTSGNKQFNITCTDSRGRTSEIFQSDIVFVNPYTAPKITKFSVSKNTNGTDAIDDDVMILNCIWEYDEIKVETSHGTKTFNECSARLQYRAGVNSDWVDYDDSIPNNTPYPLSSLSMDESISYNFRLIVTDSIGRKSEKESFSSVRTVLMDFQAGGRGLGIGKICEIDNEANDTSSLEVSMDSYFWGDMYLQGAVSMVISSAMFGPDSPEDVISDPVKGQIYFKKVSN